MKHSAVTIIDEPVGDLSEQQVYRLICLYAQDTGFRNAVSARGWLKYSSRIDGYFDLVNGYRIYVEWDGSFHLDEPFDMNDIFDIDFKSLGIS